jgi:hypothetical protein
VCELFFQGERSVRSGRSVKLVHGVQDVEKCVEQQDAVKRRRCV